MNVCSLHLDSFHETIFTLIPKPDKDTAEKGNYRQISLMNTDKKKIFNKILADQIHNTLKESYTMIKWDLSQEWKDFSVSSSQSVIQCINKLKNKNHMIISINAYKAFDKIHHPFMIKTLEEVGREGTYVNTIKATYDKPIVNVMLNSEKLMYSIVYSDVQFGLLIKSF